jgi:anti-sigma factor RsiW
MKMDCDNLGPKLSAYLDGELPDKERLELEHHLEGCSRCQSSLEELRQTGDVLKSAHSETVGQVNLEGVWEEIEKSVPSCAPARLERFRSLIHFRVWAPALGAAVAALLVFVLWPGHQSEQVTQLSRVESVYASNGQVMVLQTPESGQPLIWILPSPEKEQHS